MSDWVWLVNADGAVHRVPDNPGVVPSFVGRGWTVTDVPGDLDSDTEEFAAAFEQWQTADDVVPVEVQENSEADESATSQEEEVSNG